MRLRLLAAVFGLGVSSMASAAPGSIDQQVDQFFSQGVKHCKNAMELSRSSRGIAEAEFDRYRSYISKVEALKPELKEDVMVKRQMQQCDQVGHDIARNKALPIFEQSLSVCKEVKLLVSRDHLTRAKSKFVEYKQFRDQALGMTDTVLKVGSNASKARRCDRLQDRIVAAEERIKFSEIKADRLVSTLRKSSDSCLVTGRMLENVGNNLEKLKAAEEMLSQAQGYFKQTQNYPEAIARAENYPGYESSKRIRQYMVDYGRCEQNVVATIASQKSQILAKQNIKPSVVVESVASVETVTPAAAMQPAVATTANVQNSAVAEKPVVATLEATQQSAAEPATVVQTAEPPESANPYAQGIVEEALVQISHDIE
ncbi:MAG: hypothetical protein MI867_03950 [Pseudomonadales bacterium]|nr:hypothetical protein [Pseudomonadales bacterium]